MQASMATSLLLDAAAAAAAVKVMDLNKRCKVIFDAHISLCTWLVPFTADNTSLTLIIASDKTGFRAVQKSKA